MEPFKRTLRGSGQYPDVTFTFEKIGGRYELTHVEVKAKRRPPIPLTATRIRDVPWGDLIPAALGGEESDLRRRLGESYPDTVTGRSLKRLARSIADREGLTRKAERALKAIRASKTPGGRRPEYGPEHWAEVAAVYREAWAKGESPTAAVAREFHKSHSTAAKWVHRVRGMDPPLLPPTTKGRAKG